MKKIIYIAISVIFLISCEKLAYLPETDNIINKERTHVIPMEEALASLESFQSIAAETKSIPSIKEVFVVYSTPSLTRSSSSESDTLLYVVNYENNGGYAILAADDRIVEDVLMITNQGNISPTQFNPIYTEPDVPIVPPTPIFSYYNEELDDYYIGGNSDASENFMILKIQAYATIQLSEDEIYTAIDDSLRKPDGTPLNVYPIPVLRERDTTVRVEKLLNTGWSQGTPYNDLVPNGKSAGCVPVALAQIMAYNRYPNNYSINGIIMDWDRLRSLYSITPNSYDSQMVSTLIRYIQCEAGSVVGVLGTNNTFTLPCFAKEFLEDIGYTNVSLIREYNENILFSSLIGEKPVFIAGVDSYNIARSHGWVIDGWRRITEHYDIIDKYTNNYLGSTYKTYNMVHCNWGGYSSWTTSGVFNCNTVNGTSTYDTWYRMITYDVPF